MKKTTKDTLVMALLVFVLVGAGCISAGMAVLKSEVFLEGSSINGVDISGLTAAQAEQKVLKETEEHPVGLTVACEGAELHFDAENTGQTNKAGERIRDYLYNLDNGSASEKYDTLLAFSKDVTVNLDYDYSRDMIAERLAGFAAQFEQPAVDAFLEMDLEGAGFNIREEKQGSYLDVNEAAVLVYERLKQSGAGDIGSGDGARLELQLKTDQPQTTKQQLEENTGLIGSFTTEIENSYYQNNIDIMCGVLNGSVIMPNEVLSINSLTGERSAEKGYTETLSGSADTQDEYGEGVNQLAATLYNAALLADMEIVERNRQSVPAGYVQPGLDAVIDNATNKDLIIKNVSDIQAYIFAKREGKQLTVEIYGKPSRPEYSVRIETEVLEWMPPGEPVYVYDETLGESEKVLESQEHEGANVIVWRRYYGDNPEQPVESKRVSEDSYQPVKAHYSTGDASLTMK